VVSSLSRSRSRYFPFGVSIHSDYTTLGPFERFRRDMSEIIESATQRHIRLIGAPVMFQASLSARLPKLRQLSTSSSTSTSTCYCRCNLLSVLHFGHFIACFITAHTSPSALSTITSKHNGPLRRTDLQHRPRCQRYSSSPFRCYCECSASRAAQASHRFCQCKWGGETPVYPFISSTRSRADSAGSSKCSVCHLRATPSRSGDPSRGVVQRCIRVKG